MGGLEFEGEDSCRALKEEGLRVENEGTLAEQLRCTKQKAQLNYSDWCTKRKRRLFLTLLHLALRFTKIMKVCMYAVMLFLTQRLGRGLPSSEPHSSSLHPSMCDGADSNMLSYCSMLSNVSVDQKQQKTQKSKPKKKNCGVELLLP